MLKRLTRAVRALGLTALVTAVATGGVSAAHFTARPHATTYTLTIGTSVPLHLVGATTQASAVPTSAGSLSSSPTCASSRSGGRH